MTTTELIRRNPAVEPLLLEVVARATESGAATESEVHRALGMTPPPRPAGWRPFTRAERDAARAAGWDDGP
jgi:hypothetical protein